MLKREEEGTERKDRGVVTAGDYSNKAGMEVICFIYLCQTIIHKREEVNENQPSTLK